MGSNSNNQTGEAMDDINDKQQHKKNKNKKRKRRKKQSRNESIKQYIKNEIRWWLLISLLTSLLVFGYSSLNVGISEDLVIFYAKYNDLICHFEVDGIQTEQSLFGDVLTHQNVQNLFNSSAGLVLLSLIGLIASFLLICFKENLKKMRSNAVVGMVYFVFFVVFEYLICAWNALILFDVMDELNALIDGLSDCVDDSVVIVTDQENAMKEANGLLTEFDVLFVLIPIAIFVFFCIGWVMKIKIG